MKTLSASKIGIYAGLITVSYVIGMAVVLIGKSPEPPKIEYKEVEKIVYRDISNEDERTKEDKNPYDIGICGGNIPVEKAFWPIEDMKGEVSQCPRWYHKGIDITDKSQPNILAVNRGTVYFSGVQDAYGYGKEIIIEHEDGIYTQYAHLSEVYVKSGQRVSQGQIIGKMGHTGMVTGTALHFEVRIGGSDPSKRVVTPHRYFYASGWEQKLPTDVVIVH